MFFFFFKQKTAYEMRISDWSSDVCSSDLIQATGGQSYHALEQATGAMMGAAAQEKEVQQVFSLFNTGSPRIFADVDRDKAQILGVDPSQVYAALGTYLASTYVNDFNFLGRTFRVTAQAEPSSRSRSEEHTSELQSQLRTSYA